MVERPVESRLGLVLGGARSGKSVVAERLVARWAGGEAVTYVATATLDTDDPDLAARVAAHRLRRPVTWNTVDAGDDLPGLLAVTTGPLLVDSLGPWIASRLPHNTDPAPLVNALVGRTDPTVVVSDEVGLAVHPPTDAGRRFVDAIGLLNQAIAAAADPVWLVVAGRALVLDPPDELG
ncbi:bifunctional adenosylcobinamide kinase/adenosylcobinamide-phosphate guanylyltransferase [soil metagenome]